MHAIKTNEKHRIVGDYDIVICGSGPAGLGAAVCAAKQGAKVIVLEAAALAGGTITAVPWMPINRLLLDGGKRSYAHDAFVRHFQKYGNHATMPGPVNEVDGDGFCNHVEYSELAIYDMLDEAGVDLLLYSSVIDVVSENGCIKGVIVKEKQGYVTYRAKVVVDATGDGDVAALAGCVFAEGREEDGAHMPITLGFSIGGIEKDIFFKWWDEEIDNKFYAMTEEAEKAGCYIPEWYLLYTGTLPGIIGVNHGAWRKQSPKSSGLSPYDMTQARKNGLRIASDMVKILRENKVPGAEDCFLDRVAASLGVRDTRRIEGDYTVTYEDSQTDRRFPDTVARKHGYIDANHLFAGTMYSGFSYPYRSLVPKDVDGLLLAGRCGSATWLGHSAGKSMGNMMELGAAAGTAAALCAEKNIKPRGLDTNLLRDVLTAKMRVKF